MNYDKKFQRFKKMQKKAPNYSGLTMIYVAFMTS
jgi:hypothetical protein